jgi:N-acetylmuramoyl-L-alanine amidase
VTRIILLDPGHGGKDSGAVGNGVIEKNLSLQLCMIAKAKLTAERNDVRVYLTRDSDWRPSFKERFKRQHDLKADLVLSLHHNASATDEAYGLWLFHKHNCSTSKKISLELAAKPPSFFHSAPVRVFDAYDNPKIEGDDWLNRPENVVEGYRCPTILVEWGFVSNAYDAGYLKGRQTFEDFPRFVGDALDCFNRLVPVTG